MGWFNICYILPALTSPSAGAYVTPDSAAPTQEPIRSSGAERARQLDRTLMHGVAWTGAMKWATQVVSWGATLVIARLLTPADYGLLTMATVYLGFIQLVNEFGLGPAIIKHRDLTETQIAGLGSLSVWMGIGWWVISIAAGFILAAFYEESAVQWIVAALGFTLVTTAVKVLPRALLSRDLRFKRVAAIDAIEALTGSICTLAFAAMGLRYWSLVYGGIIGSGISALVALRWAPHRRQWPREFQSLIPSLQMGWHIVVSRFAWYLYSNADFAIVGRIFDKVTLGGYGFAWTIASIPVTRISSLVAQVTPAIFSAVQHNKAEFRRYVLKLTEGLALITFPFSMGVALVAREFVLVALGEQWKVAIVPLQLLSLYAGFRAVTTLHSQILQYAGRSRDQMRYSVLALLVLPPLFYIGGKLMGISGVAWAWIIGFPLVMIPPCRAVFEVTEMKASEYLRALAPAILASAAMAAVVWGVESFLPVEITALQRLLIQSAAGALTYAALIFGFQRKQIRVLMSMIGQLRR
jgi:PST family polysaccharide transporter